MFEIIITQETNEQEKSSNHNMLAICDSTLDTVGSCEVSVKSGQ